MLNLLTTYFFFQLIKTAFDDGFRLLCVQFFNVFPLVFNHFRNLLFIINKLQWTHFKQPEFVEDHDEVLRVYLNCELDWRGFS